jgi:hypothetical protein
MNASKISVRLDAEQRTAEIEIMTLHSRPRLEGLAEVLRDLGVQLLCTVELTTPRFRVVRSKLAALDGATLSGTRVLQILSSARSLQAEPMRPLQRRVA